MTVSRKSILVAGFLLVPLFLGGCKEFEITTEIARDGSLLRTVAVQGDSSGFGETVLALPAAPGWRTSSRPDSEEVGTIWYGFEREFRRVGDLQADIEARPGNRWAVRSRVGLEKRHRWFVTWWTWTEAYDSAWPFADPPPEDYFTPEELIRLQNDEADSTLSARGERWQIRTLYEQFFIRLRRGAVRLDDPDLVPERLDEEKETLFETVIAAADEADEDELVEVLLTTCTDFFATSAVAGLRPEIEDFNRLYREFSSWHEMFSGEGYIHQVVMPGVIIDSNADEVHMNTARWEIEPGELLYFPFSVEVTSRATNVTLLIAAGIVLAGLIAILAVLALRRT